MRAIYDRLNVCSCTLFLVNCISLSAVVLSSEVPLHYSETSKKLYSVGCIWINGYGLVCRIGRTIVTRGKPSTLKNLSQCHLVHQKSNMDWLVMEPWPLG